MKAIMINVKVIVIANIIIDAYPDNSPPEQFPNVQVLVLMRGFIDW